jgi:hypothetical protein
MFRTRDFLLLFSTIMFLLVAIGGTLISRGGTDEQVATVLTFVTDVPQEFTAEVYQSEKLSREERLALMRKKIADNMGVSVLSPEVDNLPVEEIEDEQDLVVEEQVPTDIMLCSNYQRYQGLWVPQGVQFREQEGARVVYREVSTLPVADISTPEPQQEVLLELPFRPTPLARPACLDGDVVGIAQDGSLIRNNEMGLYSVFGDNTLIGYARDGFPIYGVTNTSTDVCGGVMVAGEYRYYLSEQRETVLNCFTAQPVSL